MLAPPPPSAVVAMRGEISACSHFPTFLILLVSYQLLVMNNNKKKKIYNAHIVMNHESEARAVARWPEGVC